MDKLIIYSKDKLLELTSVRAGETKLGERMQTVSSVNELFNSTCKFVLVGLPEDVGVKANFGIAGARTAWLPALKALVNLQSTNRFRGDEIIVLGHVDFSEEMNKAEKLDPGKDPELEKLRELVTEIDAQVFGLISQILSSGKVPLIIGGGHNNSYPILKALSSYHKFPVNAINIDAHADFRSLEGRHSGNGFSYALKEGYLARYAVLGLHENYNSQSVIDELTSLKKQVFYTFFDDFIREHTSYDRAFQEALNFTQGICGLEIDMDCIAGALSSAVSPSGFNLNQVREMIAQIKTQEFTYLHIAEAASKLADGSENMLCGKAIAYLISDFVKAQL